MSIVLDSLTKRYGAHAVIDDLSLRIEDGELFVLLGPSGSGKSTVLRIIAGLIEPDSGRVLLHGRDVTRLPPQARNVGMVFQSYTLFRHMTVGENIEFGLRVRNVPAARRRDRREELLDLVGLAGFGDRYASQLSGGQQQRVAVARALAFDPSVLLLDEPFGAIDVQIRGQLRRALRRIQEHTRVTTILVTHDQEEAFELAHRIGVIDRGRLLEAGRPESLYRRPASTVVARFLGPATLLGGRVDDAGVRVGPVRLPSSDEAASVAGPRGDVAVILRPEDLLVSRERTAAPGAVLGRVTVTEVRFQGALTRLEARLSPLPGLRALDADYGDAEIPLQVAMLPSELRGAGIAAGDTAWLSLRSFGVLPRTSARALLAVTDPIHEAALRFAIDLLGRLPRLQLEVLAVGHSGGAASGLRQSIESAQPAPRSAVIETRVAPGVPAEVLGELASGRFDLGVLMGDSVEVCLRAPITTLLVRGAAPSMRRMLICTAGGEPGKADIMIGGWMAGHMGASVTLLHVAATGEDARAASGLAERHLDRGLKTLRAQGVDCDALSRVGPLPDEILSQIAEGDHDVVVLGGHRAEGRRGARRPDLAALVTRATDRSVLVVRGDAA